MNRPDRNGRQSEQELRDGLAGLCSRVGRYLSSEAQLNFEIVVQQMTSIVNTISVSEYFEKLFTSFLPATLP